MNKYLKISIAFLILFAASNFEAKNVNYDSCQDESIFQLFEHSSIDLSVEIQLQTTKGILYRLFVDDGNPLTNIAFLGGLLGGIVNTFGGMLGIGGGSAPAPPVAPPAPQYLPPPPQQNNNNGNDKDSGGMGGMMPMILIAAAFFMMIMFMGGKNR